MPAQYMFKDIPEDLDEGVDPVAVTLDNMDRYGVDQGLINVGSTVREDPRRAIREHPDRFLGLASTSTRARAWTPCARSGSSTTSTASSACRASRRAA
jgi:hypothetical protein